MQVQQTSEYKECIMKYQYFNKIPLLLSSIMLVSGVIFSGNAFANACKVRVSYSNGPFNSRIVGSENFTIHHRSTQTTLRNHMRSIKNMGSHSVNIKYWDISGDHWKSISAGSSRQVSGDLKKTECLGHSHPIRRPPVLKKIRCRAGGNMGLSYNARKNRVTVFFVRTARNRSLSSLRRGQCSVTGISTSISKFCHSGVNDMIWRLNTRSINVSSRQAPYAIKIKKGGTFTLSVRNISNGCINIR